MRKKDKLYTVNRWNKNLFLPDVDRENNNIFDGETFGQSNQMQRPNNNYTGPKLSPASNFFGGSPTYNYSNSPNIQTRPTTLSQMTAFNDNVTKRWNDFKRQLDNRWNSTYQSSLNNSTQNMLNSTAYSVAANVGANSSSSSSDGGSSADTGENKWASAGKAVGAAAAQAGSIPFSVDGRYYKRGLYDATDPFYHAGDVTFGDGTKGHIENDAGNLFSTLGVNVFQGGASTGNGYVMLAGAGLKSIGDVINNGWGYAYNDKAISNIEGNTNMMKSNARLLTDMGTTDDLLEGASNMGTALGYNAGDLVKGGVFTKGKAKRKGQKYIDTEKEAEDYQNWAFLTGIENQAKRARDLVNGSSFAFGGGLGGMTTILPYGIQDNDGNNMGAIEYDFMSDYLLNKKKQVENQDKMKGGLVGGLMEKHNEQWPLFALGGDLQTNSADYSVGKIYDVSKEEANRLKAMGYEYEVIN